MPVVRSIIPYRKSRRLRKTEPKDYGQDDDLWEPYDEAMLAPSPTVPVKSEPDAPLDVLIPNLGQSVHIPRPRNAFIFFRSDYVKAEKRVASRPGSLDQTVLSRGAGDVWREMSEDERLPYVLMAQQEKEDHALKYPNYRYAPGSANGVARKNKKPKPAALRRASTATSDSSDVRARSPVSDLRPSRKYKTNPPAPRRRKPTPVTPRRPRVPASAAPVPAVETLEPVVEEPEASPVVEELEAAPVVEEPEAAPVAEEPETAPAIEEDKSNKKDEPKIVRSSVRPSSYDRSPTQFGFKRDLSPTTIESLSLAPRPSRSPSPSIDMRALSLNDSAAASPARSPSPAAPSAPAAFEWDDWMYAPLEMNEEDPQFDAPPEEFGFYHPWNFDDLSRSCPPVLTDSFLMT